MMKKWLTTSPLLLTMLLVACGSDASTSSASNHELPNGLQPLTAYEGCDVPRLDGDWVCTWADEFNGDELDLTKWNYEIDGGGGGNQELQYYRAENVSVENGQLVITAKQESFLGRQYTSGRINTRYKKSMKYGRAVFSARVPAGRGTWPALWMMPLFNRYGGWPNSGEIDIMEYVGYDENRVHTAIHTRKFNHMLNNNFNFSKTLETASTQMHTYEMIWGPGEIEIFANGVRYGQFRYVPQLNQDVPYHHAFPFFTEFYFVINLAIGGNWGGLQGIDGSIFPAAFEVDYVRVYERDFALIDEQPPEAPGGLDISQLKNTIHWNRAIDDAGVKEYLIYIDDQPFRYVEQTQFTFSMIPPGTYSIQIQAIDHVGRTSPLTNRLSLTVVP